MTHKFHIDVPAGQIRRLWVIVCILVLIALPSAAWSETPEQKEETILRLDDGTVIELTEDAVIRKQPAISASPEENILWSILAKEPRLPLLFENSEGVPLLLYFIQERERYGEFHAVRVEDGGEQWVHPVWMHKFTPVSPIWVKPWIYFGQGAWLEKMDPDDGKIMERFTAREHIVSLQAEPDGSLEAQIELPDIPELPDNKTFFRFQDGQFSPHIVAPSNLLASLDLYKRADWLMEDFDNYLELHRLQREPLSPEYVVKWRDFELQKAEKAYRKAYQVDPTNPYFIFYLGLSLYYQHREAEAEVYFQEAFVKTANFWEESLRLGGIVCESLGFTQWADKFYEQGTRRYFQELPAHPQYVTLIEVLIHFMGQRVSVPGLPARSLHVLEMRRQVFPYTEADIHFSQEYIRALSKIGQKAKATLEKQRLQQMPMMWHDFITLTPFSFLEIVIVGSLLFGIILVKNDAHHIIPIIRILNSFGRKIFIRRSKSIDERERSEHKESYELPSHSIILNLLISSYFILLIGVRITHIVGSWMSQSCIGGKVAECIFIVAFIVVYRRRRRRFKSMRSFQHVKLFIIVWVILWCWVAWLHYYVTIVKEEASIPIPSIDRGHPNWLARFDERVENAEFQTSDLLFAQALVRHLSGDLEFARQAYEKLSDDVRALNNLGTLILDSDPNGAAEYFEQALMIDSDYTPAFYNLGVATNDQSKIRRAQIAAPWPLDRYEKFAPGKPWIVIPTLPEWSRAVYWSQGGFGRISFAQDPLFVRQIFF